MTVWRAKLNSGFANSGDAFWDEAKEYCRAAGVVGVGWGRPNLKVEADAPLEEVLEAIAAIPGWEKSGVHTVKRLATQVAEGDLVWTRDGSGAYWLGQVTGPWRFDTSVDATRWDLNNVRPCSWLPKSMRDYEVPGAVVRSFVGAASSFRRVKGDPAVRMTEMIFHEDSHPRAAKKSMTPEEVITDLLDPIDVEDIVIMLLQAEGWLILPSTRMGTTPLYEAAFRHRDDGRLAVVSVKSGTSNPVPVEELVDAETNAEVFVFSTHDRYSAPPEEHGATQIAMPQVVDFMASRPDLLPPRLARWL